MKNGQWAVIDTAVPVSNGKGHIAFYGAGMGHGFANAFIGHLTWDVGESGILEGQLSINTEQIPAGAYIADTEGMVSVFLPLVEDEDETLVVSYVYVAKDDSYASNWKMRNITTGELPAVDKRSTVTIDAARLPKLQGIEVGDPIEWSSDLIPSGFLPLHGQVIDPLTDPILGALYGPTLPDSRDFFIRGGYTGREVKSTQESSVSGDFIFVGKPYGGHMHTKYGRNRGYNQGSSITLDTTTGNADNAILPATAGTPEGVIAESGEETRPTNTAVHLITKRG